MMLKMNLINYTMGIKILEMVRILTSKVVELRTRLTMQTVVMKTLSMAISTQICSLSQIVTVNHRPVKPVVTWVLLLWVAAVCQFCLHTKTKKIKKESRLLLCSSKLMRLLHQVIDFHKRIVWTWNSKLLEYENVKV